MAACYDDPIPSSRSSSLRSSGSFRLHPDLCHKAWLHPTISSRGNAGWIRRAARAFDESTRPFSFGVLIALVVNTAHRTNLPHYFETHQPGVARP